MTRTAPSCWPPAVATGSPMFMISAVPPSRCSQPERETEGQLQGGPKDSQRYLFGPYEPQTYNVAPNAPIFHYNWISALGEWISIFPTTFSLGFPGTYAKVAASDMLSNNLLQRLGGHRDVVYGVAFHPHMPVMVSHSKDHTVKGWAPGTPKA